MNGTTSASQVEYTPKRVKRRAETSGPRIIFYVQSSGSGSDLIAEIVEHAVRFAGRDMNDSCPDKLGPTRLDVTWQPHRTDPRSVVIRTVTIDVERVRERYVEVSTFAHLNKRRVLVTFDGWTEYSASFVKIKAKKEKVKS